MIKKYTILYLAFLILFACLTLAEKALGLYGIAVGILFALFFCRQKIYVTAVCFFITESLITFSVEGVIYAGVAVAVYGIAYLIHHLTKLKNSFWETALLIAVALIPYIAINASSDYAVLIKIILSICLSLGCGYVGILALYPILIRGLRYKPSAGEIVCIGILVGLASVGLGELKFFGVYVYFFVISFLLMFLKGTDKSVVLPFGIASGIGAGIGSGNPYFLCIVAVASIVISGVENLVLPLCFFISAVTFCISLLFFGGKLDIFVIIPYCAGGIIASVIPTKLLKKVFISRQGYNGRYAMRTVVNRDREDICARITSLSSAFFEMRDILNDETNIGFSYGAVTDIVCKNVCAECVYCEKCLEKFDIKLGINRLVECAIQNGKAGLLDVGVCMGENCKKISFVLNAVNEGADSYKKLLEKREGVELGREMIISQMGGVAKLLESMAKSVKKGLSFDVEKEKLLTERLAQANIIATDVMLYKSDEGAEVTVVVREKDKEKPALKAIISHIMGLNMTPYAQKNEINDMVGISFCRASKYKIMYGESVYAKEERCGDTRNAVKLGKNKVMFVLSDGMGTGKNAQLTASNVVYLIETFYKAGFDHQTIFTSVSGMLSLRQKEDFSALDVGVIDLSTGKMDFIKQGGRESYILSQNNCEMIEGGTLPMGILAESIPKIERRTICDNETVIMMSDGVADALDMEEIRQIALQTGLHNPKAVADEILKNARSKSGSEDDMTVMAMRLVLSKETD